MKGIGIKVEIADDFVEIIFAFAVNIGRTQFDNFLCFSNRKFETCYLSNDIHHGKKNVFFKPPLTLSTMFCGSRLLLKVKKIH